MKKTLLKFSAKMLFLFVVSVIGVMSCNDSATGDTTNEDSVTLNTTDTMTRDNMMTPDTSTMMSDTSSRMMMNDTMRTGTRKDSMK